MGLDELLAKQLRRPNGFIGWLVGIMMNKGNNYMNQVTLERLSLKAQDAVLEIGFGNGKYLALLASQVRGAKIAGVDYSETMVKQASRRNRALIREGRVEIKRGSSDNLPYDTAVFTKVFTINTIYFWSDPMADLAEIRRVLQPGGTLLLVFRSKNKMEKLSFTKQGFRLYEPSEVILLVENAGFSEVKLETIQDRSLDFNCIIATYIP
jgi:ubiquinone/menaquinone biosynthesis C-methylase UbiE